MTFMWLLWNYLFSAASQRITINRCLMCHVSIMRKPCRTNNIRSTCRPTARGATLWCGI